MDRYNLEHETETATRSTKNKDLYQNIGSNQRYTNVQDVTNANAYDLTAARKKQSTREGYHHMKEYQSVVPVPKVKRELEEFNHLYQDHENKIYDINNVLEEARKNRIEKDELEEKRKLKNTNYNILASLNPKELEEYRKEKKQRVVKPDEGELRELIDTITSKTLAGEIDKATSVDLLSDLMATNMMDKVEAVKKDEETPSKEEKEEADEKLALSKEILDKEQIEKMKELKEIPKSKIEEADTDFYTRSMDLSDKDFEYGDFKERKVPLVIKILLIIILLAVVAVAIYFVTQNI